MRSIFHRFIFIVLLLPFLTFYAFAWPTWFKKSHRQTLESGGEDSTPTSGNSHSDTPSSPVFFESLKTRTSRDKNANRLMAEVEAKSRISYCWKAALEGLKEGCTSLRADDRARSHLALAMAICDDEADGGNRAWPKCKTRDDVSSCIHQLDNTLYLVYVQYRLHTDVLCLYIQEEVFQERTEVAVRNLHASAVEASNSLQALWASSGELHTSVKGAAEQQASNLAETRRLYEQLQELRHTQTVAFDSLRDSTQYMIRSVRDASLSLEHLHASLDESTSKAVAAVNDVAREAAAFQSRTELHVSSMVHVLERVENFQRALVEGTAGIGEIMRAAFLLAMLVLLTIPARTAAARLPCICVVAAAYAFRPLFETPQHALGHESFFFLLTLAAGAVLLFFACTYQSPEYALRLLLRCEVRRVFDDMRPLLVEDFRFALSEGIIRLLPPKGEEDVVQRFEVGCSTLCAPLHRNGAVGDEEERPAVSMATKLQRKTPNRSRSRRR